MYEQGREILQLGVVQNNLTWDVLFQEGPRRKRQFYRGSIDNWHANVNHTRGKNLPKPLIDVHPRKRGPCAPATAPLSTRQQTPKGPVPETTRFACIPGPPHAGGTLLSLLGRFRSTELSTATAVGSPSVVLRELVVSLSFGGSFIA